MQCTSSEVWGLTVTLHLTVCSKVLRTLRKHKACCMGECHLGWMDGKGGVVCKFDVSCWELRI
jgi:hypothetical protein